MKVLVFQVVLLFISALSLVTSSDRARTLFIAIGKMEETQNALEIDYKQLQLERTTLARHQNIDPIARQSLGMVSITPKDTIYIRMKNGGLELLNSTAEE